MTTKLITATSILETKTYNPFDFLIYPVHYNQLPLQYDELQKNYFCCIRGQLISQLLLDYGTSILKTSNNTIPF
jgi:hypothetical protein